MGDVGKVINDAVDDIKKAAADLAAEATELVMRNKLIAGVATVINPTLLIGTYSATSAPAAAVGVVDELVLTAKHIPELQWYYFLNPYSIYAGAAQRRREALRRQANERYRVEAEALARAVDEYQRATSAMIAERATGELRLLNARLAATYVGSSTFVSDDKPAEWRMYEQLYGISLISSDEWRRQRAYASIRPFGIEAVEEDFMNAARYFRAQY